MKAVAKCLWCDKPLHTAPTRRWWVKKCYGQGLCYDCILSLAGHVLSAMERERKATP